MDKFGIGKIGMPGFGIEGFRLPVFGSGSGVVAGSKFHPSLVDAWFMSGISNADNPSFIKGVKGNKLQLKNFAYALSSGFGKYEHDFRTWLSVTNNRYPNVKVTDHSATITGSRNYIFVVHTSSSGSNAKGFKVKIEGLDSIKEKKPNEKIVCCYQYFEASDGVITKKYYPFDKDGIYSLPDSEIGTDAAGFIIYAYDDKYGYALCNTDLFNGFTITQLPSDYEGALVFDGVDDCAVCDNLPILTDYTLICRRVLKELEEDESVNFVVASKSLRTENNSVVPGAFTFEQRYDSVYGVHSFGQSYPIVLNFQDFVSAQSTTRYNGSRIDRGTATDSNVLHLGSLNSRGSFMKGAIYYFALYNKSLTTEEIEQQKALLHEEWQKRLLNV